MNALAIAAVDAAPDLVLEMLPLELSLLNVHPDVVLAGAMRPEPAGPSEPRLAVWLKAGAEGFEVPNKRFGLRPEPARLHELEFFGDGEPHPTFWRRWPGLEHLQVLSEPEGPDGPAWWGARIWLMDEAATRAGIAHEPDRGRRVIEF